MTLAISKQALMRFIKLFNPLIFINSKDMSFFNQLSRIKNKLYKNADYYFTKSIKLIYIKGLIKGKATKHILLRLRDNAINLYTII